MSRAITSLGPCRCSSIAVVQWDFRVKQAFQPRPIPALNRGEHVANSRNLLSHG